MGSGMSEVVLVTGGSGFVAGWCIVELLRAGYQVRTTVRGPEREQGVRAAVGPLVSTDKLSFHVGDLMDDAGWDAATGGCDFVLHVASPMTVGGDVDAFVRPAREGTLRVLEAATQARVKRIVMTSSCAAATPTELGVDTVSDESVWSDPAALAAYPYRLSKTLAERAAWDFMRERGGDTTFATILPSAVFGPVLAKDGLGSVDVIKRLVDGRMPFIPRVGLNIVDVRDLAKAHVLAMTRPEAAGRRFIANGDFMWMREVAGELRAKLGSAGARIPTVGLPDFVVRAGAAFSPALRQLVPLLGRSHRFSSSAIRDALGWTSRPARETVVDCARSLVAAGAL